MGSQRVRHNWATELNYLLNWYLGTVQLLHGRERWRAPFLVCLGSFQGHKEKSEVLTVAETSLLKKKKMHTLICCKQDGFSFFPPISQNNLAPTQNHMISNTSGSFYCSPSTVVPWLAGKGLVPGIPVITKITKIHRCSHSIYKMPWYLHITYTSTFSLYHL